MKKNVAGQKVGCQMVSASDGSAFTSAVTVYVTGDAGTQAVGSVGSGACTHEGNGYHTYAPAQAETNYDLVAFTFVGSGAIPATVQVYTGYPQTGDSYAEVTSGSYGLAVIEAQTDDIGAAGAGLTAIPWNASWDAEVQSEVADALAVYDPPTHAEMTAELATADDATLAAIAALNDLDAAGVRAAVGLAAANLDTQLGAVPTATENADALLDRDMAAGTDSGGRTPRNALRFLRNKWTNSGGMLTVCKENDATTAWTAATTTAAGDPVDSIDPA